MSVFTVEFKDKKLKKLVSGFVEAEDFDSAHKEAIKEFGDYGKIKKITRLGIARIEDLPAMSLFGDSLIGESREF